MKVVFDIEANGLHNPTKIWVVVCKDMDTGQYHIFRNLNDNEEDRIRFDIFSRSVELWCGHHILGYDIPVIHDLLGLDIPVAKCLDTLIVSKLVDYSRNGHSIEDYGLEFGIEKGKFNDFSRYSDEMERYCIRDVDIAERIYRKYHKYISAPERHRSIRLEHDFQLVCNQLEKDGFAFNSLKAQGLLQKVEAELNLLDEAILSSFPPRLKFIREVTPKETKHGTISLSSVPQSMRKDIADLTVGAPFSYCSWVEFNPSSHKQIISVLNDSGWSPTDRTKTHIDAERELNKLQRERSRDNSLDLRKQQLHNKLNELKITGWKVNEQNLETLPAKAPAPIRTIANRIILEARRRTLVEWLSLVRTSIKVEKKSIKIIGGDKIDDGVSGISNSTTDSPSKSLIRWLKNKKVNVLSVNEMDEHFLLITVTQPTKFEDSSAEDVIQLLDGLKRTGLRYTIISERIHGRFLSVGAWTHRMAHQNPNTANIPNEYDTAGKKKLYGKELRSFWCAPKNRLLVGTDAEGIQLRIFAHYINDPDFTKEVVSGDVHSLNQSVLGTACRTREAAKRFIYALLLGAGLGKLAEILGCEQMVASEALERLIARYPGFALLKETIIPADAKRGWFVGLDGRAVRIPGETVGSRRHLAMSGYLQNGEAVVMKMATLKWWPKLPSMDAKLVNFVHDEWQVECPNNMEVALRIANMMADSLREVGEELKLHCPLAGSFYNKKAKDYTIDINWSKTH